MKSTKSTDTCPHCGSDDWILTHEKDRHGDRSSYNPEIVYCRNCQEEYGKSKLIPGKIKYYLYAGYSFDTPEEVIEDLKKRLKDLK